MLVLALQTRRAGLASLSLRSRLPTHFQLPMRQGHGHGTTPHVPVPAVPTAQGHPPAAATLSQLQLRRQFHTRTKLIQTRAATLSGTSHRIQTGSPSLASAIIIAVVDLTGNQLCLRAKVAPTHTTASRSAAQIKGMEQDSLPQEEDGTAHFGSIAILKLHEIRYTVVWSKPTLQHTQTPPTTHTVITKLKQQKNHLHNMHTYFLASLDS